uniref:Uncharacterized protein n=1 Tax=Tetranychus urticae TaxID=32264 RepID=T1KV88_TETUR
MLNFDTDTNCLDPKKVCNLKAVPDMELTIKQMFNDDVLSNDIYGIANSTNVQGEEVEKLYLLADSEKIKNDSLVTAQLGKEAVLPLIAAALAFADILSAAASAFADIRRANSFCVDLVKHQDKLSLVTKGVKGGSCEANVIVKPGEYREIIVDLKLIAGGDGYENVNFSVSEEIVVIVTIAEIAKDVPIVIE